MFDQPRALRVKVRMKEILEGLSYDLSWGDAANSEVNWLSELRSLYLLMIKEGFGIPELRSHKDALTNLRIHERFLKELEPLLRDAQTPEAKASSHAFLAKLNGKNIPVYEMPSLWGRLFAEKPKLLER